VDLEACGGLRCLARVRCMNLTFTTSRSTHKLACCLHMRGASRDRCCIRWLSRESVRRRRSVSRGGGGTPTRRPGTIVRPFASKASRGVCASTSSRSSSQVDLDDGVASVLEGTCATFLWPIAHQTRMVLSSTRGLNDRPTGC